MNLARMLSAAIPMNFSSDEGKLGGALLDDKIIYNCQTNYMMPGREVDGWIDSYDQGGIQIPEEWDYLLTW